jgi:hypothetical protein
MKLEAIDRVDIPGGDKEVVLPGDAPNKTPNDLLAEEIAQALSAAGLIPENRRADLLSKLKTGGVKQEDWGLWVDIATAPKQTEGKDHE